MRRSFDMIKSISAKVKHKVLKSFGKIDRMSEEQKTKRVHVLDVESIRYRERSCLKWF